MTEPAVGEIIRMFDATKKSKFEMLEKIMRVCYYLKNATHSKFLTKDYDENGLWCRETFDGFSCWDRTPAGAIAYQPCPHFIVGFDKHLYSYKKCNLDGFWDNQHEQPLHPRTNYTTCVNMADLLFRKAVNDIYVTGYSVSVAALLLSIAIFLFFRSLQCTRIRIHIHLFAAFALNNILWIVWFKTVVNTVTVLQENKIWCQLLHVITNYFMVTSYFWMFCEGLHLHIALVVVFVKDEVAMKCFMAIGWGLSLVVALIYAVSRYIAGTTERCWTDDSDAFWIIVTPVVISLLASLVFLINVLRVLCTKLHPTLNNDGSDAAKKATRAALILIPLFGLHFILIPFHPSPDAPWEKFYQVFSALLTSFQGLCLAVLFCFTNQDVLTAIRTYLVKTLTTPEAIPMTGITAGESLMNTRDNVV